MTRPDYWLFGIASLLSLLGILVSLSIAPDRVSSQLIVIAFGLVAFFLLNSIDYSLLRVFIPYGFGLVTFGLLLTLILGVTTRGSTRWLDLGFINLQLSEFIKPVLVVYLSYLIHRYSLKKIQNYILALGWIFLPALLVFLEPDLGSTLIILMIAFSCILAMRPKKRFIIATILFILLSIPIGLNVIAPYQKTRVLSFLQPEKDPLGSSYNQIQAVIAAGSGQLIGKGLGKGTQSHLAFLPERHTDFFFASLSEELGFIGAFLVILLFISICGRLLLLASQTKEKSLQVVFIGVFMMIFSQFVIHTGINLGILPVTGLTLPFMSIGGSSMLSNWIALGFASSCSKEVKPNRAIFLRYQ